MSTRPLEQEYAIAILATGSKVSRETYLVQQIAVDLNGDIRKNSRIRRSPVLIFSPGEGMIRELYTAQMEELASHGYVVAAISHPYEAILTVFPDKRCIKYNGKRWPVTPSIEGEANMIELEWHAEDIRFVLDELTHSQEAGFSTLPFVRHLDLARVGAFGHSFGGIAVGHACQTDSRFKACLNEDGEVGMRPLYLDDRGWALNQAYMLIERASARAVPSDRDLAAMRMTRSQAVAIHARLATYHGWIEGLHLKQHRL